MLHLQSSQEYLALIQEAAQANQPLIIKWTGSRCGPCRVIQPIFESLSKAKPKQFYAVCSIDNPNFTDLMQNLQISAVPTFIRIEGPDEVARFSGADSRRLYSLINGDANSDA